eukprot:TRINITY_DN67928_c0_g1_i1.p1 TRINITY_DN67928_c0_g1~~TRINITY_DN67928_c0_g1_i1.p1  ORF type:complete len:197 (+),score=7.27 TRINITY_DN67928_c0_g1_i1:60-650(+)
MSLLRVLCLVQLLCSSPEVKATTKMWRRYSKGKNSDFQYCWRNTTTHRTYNSRALLPSCDWEALIGREERGDTTPWQVNPALSECDDWLEIPCEEEETSGFPMEALILVGFFLGFGCMGGFIMLVVCVLVRNRPTTGPNQDMLYEKSATGKMIPRRRPPPGMETGMEGVGITIGKGGLQLQTGPLQPSSSSQQQKR